MARATQRNLVLKNKTITIKKNCLERPWILISKINICRNRIVLYSAWHTFVCFFLMYISILTSCNYVHHVCSQYPSMPEEVFGSHGTAFTNSCEPLYRFWKPNPRSSVRATNTLTIKPSLQPWAHNLSINGEMVNIWLDLKTFQNLPSKLDLALHAYNPSRRLENFRLAWTKYILSQTDKARYDGPDL